MNSRIFYSLMLFTILKSYMVNGQNYDNCEWGYCTHCSQKFLYRAWVVHSEFKKDQWSFNGTGAYDSNCNQDESHREAKQNQFDKSKEKVKNGQKVVLWWNNGKAMRTRDEDSYCDYSETGVIQEKFKTDTLFVYSDGKLINKGPAVFNSARSVALKNGQWKENGKILLYENGNGHEMTKEELYEFETINSTSISSFPDFIKFRPFLIVFNPDTYTKDLNDGSEYYFRTLSEKINKMGNEVKSITIVSQFNNLGNADEETKKAMYILSLNRALVVKNELKKRVISSHIEWSHISCLDLLYQDYTDFNKAYPNASTPKNRTIEVYVNYTPKIAFNAYDKLKGNLGYSSQESIISNVYLLKIILWNTYMTTYGTNRDEIFKKIPVEYKDNIHIKKAINDLPDLLKRYNNKEFTATEYKNRINARLSKITEDTYNTNIY